MTTRRAVIGARRRLHSSRLLQITLVALFWGLGEAIVRVSGLPVPGGILGMGMVLVLLASGRLGLASVRRGANWYIAEMLLFFVPAVMAILDHGEFIGLLGLKIAAVILLGTVSVMAGTALAVDLCLRFRADATEGAPHADA